MDRVTDIRNKRALIIGASCAAAIRIATKLKHVGYVVTGIDSHFPSEVSEAGYDWRSVYDVGIVMDSLNVQASILQDYVIVLAFDQPANVNISLECSAKRLHTSAIFTRIRSDDCDWLEVQLTKLFSEGLL